MKMKMRVSDLLPYKATRYQQSMNAFVPREAIVPLKQERDTTTLCVVSKGDVVKEGQVLATSRDINGSVIHSPVPGVVTDIGYVSGPDGRRVHAVRVRLRGEFSFYGKARRSIDWEGLPPGSLRRTIASAGVVNTFGRTVTLAHQMERLMERRTPTLVVRLFDLDPSCMVDRFIAERHPGEVMTGVAVIAAALGTSRVLLVLPQDFDPVEPLQIPGRGVEYITMESDTSFYPVGGKRDLMALVSRGGRRDVRVGFRDLYIDSSTAYAVYESVVQGQPMVEKFIQVSGHAIYGEGILKVRLGTPLRSLVAELGGFVRDAGKIVVNGILMGHNVTDLDTPVTKEVKSIIVIPPRDTVSATSSECIRCGMCRNVCPMDMAPDILYGHYTFGREVSQGYLDTLRNCSDCVLCNAVCPARLPLCQSIKLLRGASNEKS